ncbi:hypothetical protein DQ244_05080 [Blastococcus sp. TBT05-19]|uniref:hypothetical protein n=1 Tax=Blastococcus sp. TBT05-19 TaxID=2250581 RepID=UPI000DEABEEA|nr:hypothetical protein [Blastococcus sp. TBT05-19]RBY94662.1 hypothetical protein DQ244_05080 [Blastococcus sp. TBT05-19]
MTASLDDDARWAEARRIVDGLPSETLEARVRRLRGLTILAVVGGVLVSIGLGLAFSLIAGHDGGTEAETPAWRRIVGVLGAAGSVVLVLTALRIQWRARRRFGLWTSPLMVLDRQQQKRLHRELRGTEPLDPEHVPLVRLLAENQLNQRSLIVTQLGLLLLFTGQWISSPSPWRATMVGFSALLVAGTIVVVRRNERPALRFLAEHPPERSAA